MYHVLLNSPSTKVVLPLSSPQTTEVGIGYFKPDISGTEQKMWLDIGEEHERNNMAPWPAYLACSGGWMIGEQEHKHHGPAKAYLGLWGYGSRFPLIMFSLALAALSDGHACSTRPFEQ